MFKKGRVKKAHVSIQKRKWKTSRSNLKEWDNSLSDLTVHKASEEEQQRRRLIHRSKNAEAARRALGERAKRVFLDPASPAQVELEMKKLAILKEVLYDHDDLNEVLKRVDNTMSSVKTIFHEAPYRKSGHPVITLAPGAKSGNVGAPVKVPEEPATQMSILSDSVMDKQALNDEQSSSEDEAEEDKFESKVDYERFLNVLRESLNKSMVPQKNLESADGDATMTPVSNGNKKSGNERLALNCTEEVKRTMSRIDDHEADIEVEEKSSKTIDGTISKMTGTVNQMKQKNRSVSFTDENSTRPRANITSCTMTYEDLKEAMESVANNLAEMENRRGNSLPETANISLKSDGLAGFTATLIDAVTRLTVYVNEAEAKLFKSESFIETLKNQSDHQRALLDALTAELMGTQDQIQSLKDEAAKQKEEFESQHIEFKKTVRQDMQELKNRLESFEKSHEERMSAGGDGVSNRIPKATFTPLVENLQIIDAVDSKTDKEQEEEALKSDMLSLLGALKCEQSEVLHMKAQEEMTRPVLPMNNDTTKGAAQTVASVESQLRHLQLQHTEAQNRLQELTQVAGYLAGKVAESERSQSSASSCKSDPVTPISSSSESHSITSGPLLTPQNNDEFRPMIPTQSNDETDDSISGITITSSMFANIDTSRPSVQSSSGMQSHSKALPLFYPKLAEDSSSLKSIDCVNVSDNSHHSLDKNINVPTLLQSNIFGNEALSKNDNDFQEIFGDMDGHLLSLPSFKPTAMTYIPKSNPQNVTNSIQQTQCNLEDRIAELNRQHAEAQSRLQNLIRKRGDIRSPSQSSSGSSKKLIQVTLPSDDMLKTPQVYKPRQPFQPSSNPEEDCFT